MAWVLLGSGNNWAAAERLREKLLEANPGGLLFLGGELQQEVLLSFREKENMERE